MSAFRFRRDEVLFELPSCEGHALMAWSQENDPWGRAERDSDGYIAQHREAKNI